MAGLLLGVGPLLKVGAYVRVHQGIEASQQARVSEYGARQHGPVQPAGSIVSVGPEGGGELLAQLGIVFHEPPGPGIGVINRYAQRVE